MPDVDLLLPCLDEEAGLRWLLPLLPGGIRPIVVDNGSTDRTVAVARAAGCLVVPAAERGYGAACHAGLVAATAGIVAVMDADATLDPRQLDRVLAPVADGTADLALGRRRARSRSAWPYHLRIANAELARRVRRRTGTALRDLGPMRAARREALLSLALTDRRSGYPAQTVVRAADAGWRIVEADIDYLPRAGRSKVTGTPWGAVRAVHDLSRALRS